MSGYLIATLILGILSSLTVVLQLAGVLGPGSTLSFNRLYASIASVAATFALLATLAPTRGSIVSVAAGLAAFTVGLGIMNLASVVAALLDGRAFSPPLALSGAIFLAQGLCTFRHARLGVSLVRRDPPSGPGPLVSP